MRRVVVGLLAALTLLGPIGAAGATSTAGSADLAVTGSYGLGQHVGDTEMVGVGVSNAGPRRAVNVTLDVAFSDEYSYQSATGPCAQTSSNDVSCDFGKIRPGHDPQATITLLAVAAGHAQVTLTESSPTPDPNPANDQTVFKIPVQDNTPIFTVTPSTGLTDLEHVHVKLANVPSDEYVIWECDANFPAHGMYDCMTLGSGVYNPMYEKFMKTSVKVHAGPIGSSTYGGSCGTSAADNDCIAIVAKYTIGTPDFTGMPSVPISFAVAS